MTTTALQSYLQSRAPADRRAAFAELLSSHGPAIRRTCRGFERSPSRQEELQQDVLVEVWRALPRLESAAAARSWVLRIAHNVALKHVRYEAPRSAAAPVLPVEGACPAPAADEALDQARRRARLAAAVHALPALDRSLVLLWLEGLDHRALAEATGLSPTNARTRLSRARARLRTTLGA
jgi:RNA polymerase sigma-70 factor (ECF subfamily)